MAYWLEGWLEVRRGGEQYEPAWAGVVRLGPLLDVADAVSERLFGLSKGLTSSVTPVVAVAAGRGIPRDPSPELRCDLDRHASHEREFGPGELGGYTHATWDELAEHTAEVSELDEGDWAVVFDIGKRLASDYRFGGKGVRIVVWYNW